MSAVDGKRPVRLLTQNRELRAIGVWNWTLPAWAGRLMGQGIEFRCVNNEEALTAVCSEKLMQ